LWLPVWIGVLTWAGCLMTADENLWRDSAPVTPDARGPETTQNDSVVDVAADTGERDLSDAARDLAQNDLFDAIVPDAACGQMVLVLAAAEDDGEIDGTTWDPDGETQGDICIGTWSGQSVWGYFRFGISQAIPAGATIVSATLELWGHSAYTYSGWQWNPSTHALEVYAEKAATAQPITGVSDAPFAPQGRPVTTATVRWPNTGGLAWLPAQYNTSPSLTPVLQELVSSQGGLGAGHHLQLWVRGAQLTQGEVATTAYGTPGFKPARLTLGWCP
jgi:hypothetical protein